jgi:hypothetical protein
MTNDTYTTDAANLERYGGLLAGIAPSASDLALGSLLREALLRWLHIGRWRQR